ncbi:MAG: PAS domain S-box protein, partial [Acidobacteria bacterium]|nr:PAS domain S-box protein [Acidobacteriota bacterium]
ALETSLRETETRFAQKSDELNSERARLDSLRAEFEQKIQDAEKARAASEASLHEAQARLAQQTEELNTERSQRDALRAELEQKAQHAEQLRTALETSLRETETRFAQKSDELNSERARLDSLRAEFEQKIQDAEKARAASETALQEIRARLAQQTEELNALLSQRGASQSELEQKISRSEEQRAFFQAALQEAEALLSKRTDEHNAERTQWDKIRLESEQRQKAAEEQRASLQIALDEVETYLSKQVENFNAERSQWNIARLDLEQKCLRSEEDRLALQKALQEAESALANRIEDQNSEIAQWKSLQSELELKCQAADVQQAALRSALQEAEGRCARMSEEIQNKSASLDEALGQMEQLQAELKQLRDELADLHLRYQSLSQLSSAGVVLATMQGRVLRCNDAAARMFGYAGMSEAQEQIGENQFHLYSFEDALKSRLLRDGKLENIEWCSLTRDGRLIRIQESSKLVVAPSGEEPHVERILTDISKIHRLGEEIRRARRMESTTDLATATIKSLQDLCESLANRGERLLESADDDRIVRSLTEDLLKDAKRGMKHAHQFFSAIQKSDRVPELLKLNEVLASNDVLLHNLLGEDIDLQTKLSSRAGLVSANRKDLVQLISNLMASSREALPLGGSVIIETSNIEIEPGSSVCPPNMQPGTYVLMTIAADGCSVYAERRIGSIQAIVERMGGWLETANNTQAGNIYKIYLPRVETFSGLPAPFSKPADN